jgi:hypothetical protein
VPCFTLRIYGGASNLFLAAKRKTIQRMIQRMPDFHPHPASWRDPAGFVFLLGNEPHRQINISYTANYRQLMDSGLYQQLLQQQQIIPHTELQQNFNNEPEWLLTIKPEKIPFVSYPYEWSTGMLKDAALLTLSINKTAMQKGMVLKDATPFNIQFHKGKPVFIDTLSFEKYDETKPWIAYRQFCETFLFPLYLCHYTKTSAQKWLALYPEGLPVAYTAQLLPFKCRFSLGAWLHVYLQKHITGKPTNQPAAATHFTRQKLLYLMDGLISTVKKINTATRTTWSNYYNDTILSQQYLQEKEKIFRAYLSAITFDTVLDLGANDGHFSAIAAANAVSVVAVDADSNCINNLYRSIRSEKNSRVLPLVIDILNPSPGVGLNNEERASFLHRARANLVTALALIHHLHFSGNMPLHHIAGLLQRLTGKYLIVEFIPATDEKVKIITGCKDTRGHAYSQQLFEKHFATHFTLLQAQPVAGSERILYLMEKINRPTAIPA